MNFALVDDEQLHLDTLKQTLLSALERLGLDAERIDCYSSTQSFLSEFDADKYDVIILDIYIDTLNGIDVARKIREKDENAALAFCTSSNEFASQSYEVNARDYLQKPITEDKIMAMLKRFRLAKIERNRSIRLPDGFRVPLRSIIYAEYINHSVCLYIKEQNPHTIRANQSDIEALLLPHKGFCVINKGCIVNLAQVRAIKPNEFQMQGGEVLPIARRRYKEIEEAYKEYIFRRMLEEVSD